MPPPLPDQSVGGYDESLGNTALQASLDADMELLLPRRIEFVRARKQVTAKGLSGLDKKDNAPQRPNKWVFKEGGLDQYHGWRTSKSYGAGLRNQGNTCYLNSTLQCLSYVSAFAQASEAKVHERTCARKRAGVWCGLCNLSSLICRIHQSHGGHISPTEILRYLNLFFARFRPGRQEDAHDALRQLIDTCIRSEALPPKISSSAQNRKAPFVNPLVSQTTMLGQMFGYHTAQRIQCGNCGHVSSTFHFDMDISLSINRCRTIDECLTRYFAPEIFKEQNAYKCAKCKRTVTAKKTTALYDAPMNLTLSLKRYGYGRFGGRRQKDGHYVKYEKELDLSKFIADSSHSSSAAAPSKYTLSGVLVHSGATPQLGHYYAFVRNPAGFWYCCDDESVTPAKEHTVLSQQAYILFYERKRSKKDTKNHPLNVEAEHKPAVPEKAQKKDRKSVPSPLHHQSLFYNSLASAPDTPSTTASRGEPLENQGATTESTPSTTSRTSAGEAPTAVCNKRAAATAEEKSPKKARVSEEKADELPPAGGLQEAVVVRLHPPKFADGDERSVGCDDEEEDGDDRAPKDATSDSAQEAAAQEPVVLAEVVRPASSGTSATIKAKERASLARSVRSQYGANKISSWDSDDDEEESEEGIDKDKTEQARKEAMMQAQRKLQPKIAMRDSHDREYDKGKNRHKVRQHVESKTNDFAAAYRLGFVLAFTALYLGDWYTCSWKELNLGTWTGKVVLQFGLSGMKLLGNEDAVKRYPSIRIARECQEMVGGLVADQSKAVSESDCQVADAVLVTTAATGTIFVILTTIISLCTAATFIVTGTSRFGRLSAMTLEPNRADKAMFSVKWVTGFVALFIILTFGSLIALFPAALFKEHVCPVAEHVLPSVVNDDTSLGTSGIGALGEGREASHHTGASAYLALIACFFFLLSSVFILSRMSIVAWCMELCGEVEFGMEYESEEEQNAFDDGGNGSIDSLKEREEGRGPVDAGGHGPGGRRARLESIVVYDPAGMKSNAGHDFESISSNG
ncbi:hypothetical protein FOZ61_001741 [Perkinsus olseni]|uniref:ubiquitinyl hydrolase 1 n=1 Tax=Perkinsus olseni TaxID=32597 RepID=A0A7J6LVY1_PEROL|nr:hypothetical protein FOZ61_001741 [Perkinsus olseni]